MFRLRLNHDGAHHVLVAGTARNAAEELERAGDIRRERDTDGLPRRYHGADAKLR